MPSFSGKAVLAVVGLLTLVGVVFLLYQYRRSFPADEPAEIAKADPPTSNSPRQDLPAGTLPGISPGAAAQAPRSDNRPTGSVEMTAVAAADELPPLPESPYRNVSGEAQYVGSAACAECHAEEHENYSLTTHHHSFGLVDAAAAPADGSFDDPSSGRSYRVYRQQGQLHHQELIKTADGTEVVLADHPPKYVVGSGNHAHTYLIESDGFLAESPITWFSTLQAWALSPGYERVNSSFGRPVNFECLYCHTGRVEAVEGVRARVEVHTATIDCERCHGPGSLHVDQRTAGGEFADPDWTIVNPHKLPRESQEDVCAQCHMHGVATVEVRGRNLKDYVPGRDLKQFQINYALQHDNQAMEVVGHFEQMRLSACYQQTESLTCTTCHDPHARLPAEKRVEHYRSKCLTCHTQESCGMAHAERLRQSADDNCVTCHMPTSPTEVLHLAATHHRIGIHHAVEAPRPQAAGDLVPLADLTHLPEVDQQRCLGLAYLHASLQENRTEVSEAYRVRARELLEKVWAQGVRDPETGAALATVYLIDNPPQAVQLGQQVLQSPQLTPPTEVKTLAAISQALLRMRQLPEAVNPLERLVQLRRQGVDWMQLSICRGQQGNGPGALDAARRAAEIMPYHPNVQRLLADIHQGLGNPEQAAQHLDRATLLERKE